MGTAVGQVGPRRGSSELGGLSGRGAGAGEGRERLKDLVVYILNPMLVYRGLGKTAWETEAGVWKPENKHQKLLSQALSEGRNRMPEKAPQMPTPGSFGSWGS